VDCRADFAEDWVVILYGVIGIGGGGRLVESVNDAAVVAVDMDGAFGR